MIVYERQKMRENIALNADDIATLTAFANQGDNLAKLGWDLLHLETWEGIYWAW
jgi:hypothetical protein